MIRKRILLLWMALWMALALAACNAPPATPTATPITTRVRIAADGDTAPLMRALTDAYFAENPYVIFSVDVGSPAFVSDELQSGKATLAATALPPADGARWMADLAMDGIAIIVHPQNAITDITLQDARAIFAGERNNWLDYNVDGLGPIEVAVREAGDGSRHVFDERVMGAQKLTLDAFIMPSLDTMLNFPLVRPNAIGYAPSSGVARQPTPVKMLSVNGIAPSPEAIRDGGYPLGRTLSLMALREPQDALRDFVAWALGPAGRQIAAQQGYVPMP
jgi:phosphate transport system substrate-binding protein